MRKAIIILSIASLSIALSGRAVAHAAGGSPPPMLTVVMGSGLVTLHAANVDQQITYRSVLPSAACDVYLRTHTSESRDSACSHIVTFTLSAPSRAVSGGSASYVTCCGGGGGGPYARNVHVYTTSGCCGGWWAQTATQMYYNYYQVWLPYWSPSNCTHTPPNSLGFVLTTQWCNYTDNYSTIKMSAGQD